MSNGFYTAASSMLNAQRKIGVLSNNIANINTPGFRSQNVVMSSFEQQFLARIEKGDIEGIGTGAPIQVIDTVSTSFDPSVIRETKRPFDFAINGEGFFNVVQTRNLGQGEQVDQEEESGQRMLTRNGSFDLDAEGYLVLQGVGKVQGSKGDIRLNSSDFVVDSSGTIFQQGKRVDSLLITMPSDDVVLSKMGNGVFPVENEEENLSVEIPSVIQGAIEASNVDVNREMIRVMEAQRALQSASSALKIVDRMNQRATTEIASL